VQRARTVHLISAENYSYVINDLTLTGILAAAMFFVILVLHFIIG
jgi:ribose/xylose/arabinose/galactoside ABC-type transport system permease subunit